MNWRGWVRRVVISLGVLAAVAVVAVGALVAWEWTFLCRAFTIPDCPVTDAAWYRPTDPVPGGPGPDLPVSAKPQISANAVARAAAYAERKESSALLVLHRGEVVAEHYWRGHGRDARTCSMSMAKTLVGLLVGAAIADGTIAGVDEPASTYLTEWAGDGRAGITVRHLLQMASGLEDAEHYDDPFSAVGRMWLGPDSLPVVAAARLDHEPGSRFAYSSVDTQALAVVLERATGRRYADYLSEKVWRPVGASDAAVWLDRPGGLAKTFGGVLATARDWARVGLLLQNGGRVGGRQVIPAAWVRDMLTPSPRERDYGYQIWLGRGGCRREDHEEPFLAPDVAYLDGRFKQRVYVVPSAELVVVRLGEQARGWDEAEVVNTLLRGLTPPR
jgi:CubicO group peptidase (beta-lactamase class C family)